MRVLVGTSGFSYAAWKGRFYPADLAASRMLAFYAARFPAVEINNTFYRMPAATTLERWAAAVPREFEFAIKAPRRITHEQRLENAMAPLSRLLAVTHALGGQLGPLLFQLPPNLKQDLPLLEAFLALVPAGVRCAFEFRHPSWFADRTYATLRARGAALCAAQAEKLASPLVPTAGFGYLRLRRPDYGPHDVAVWAERIVQQPWREAFVFFKHEDEARGPLLAAQMLARLASLGAVAPVPPG